MLTGPPPKFHGTWDILGRFGRSCHGLEEQPSYAPPYRSNFCHLDDQSRFAISVTIMEKAQLEAVTFAIQFDYRQPPRRRAAGTTTRLGTTFDSQTAWQLPSPPRASDSSCAACGAVRGWRPVKHCRCARGPVATKSNTSSALSRGLETRHQFRVAATVTAAAAQSDDGCNLPSDGRRHRQPAIRLYHRDALTQQQLHRISSK